MNTRLTRNQPRRTKSVPRLPQPMPADFRCPVEAKLRDRWEIYRSIVGPGHKSFQEWLQS